MKFGAVIIGDEVLSGRRQDKHLPELVAQLGQINHLLGFCHILPDDASMITDMLKQTMASGTHVFCFGGIGATPDDLTRPCAASAAGVNLVRHAGAQMAIEKKFGEAAFPHRVLMADLPEGAGLIPNPYNQVPGFYINQHYFMPGFPQMAHPMVAWVLSQLAPVAQSYIEENIWVLNTSESDLLDYMVELRNRFPQVRLFSLPILYKDQNCCIEFGFKGAPEQVKAAMCHVKQTLNMRKIKWQDTRPNVPKDVGV